MYMPMCMEKKLLVKVLANSLGDANTKFFQQIKIDKIEDTGWQDKNIDIEDLLNSISKKNGGIF